MQWYVKQSSKYGTERNIILITFLLESVLSRAEWIGNGFCADSVSDTSVEGASVGDDSGDKDGDDLVCSKLIISDATKTYTASSVLNFVKWMLSNFCKCFQSSGPRLSAC